MINAELVGKITRFGSEYRVLKSNIENSYSVRDRYGNEFKLIALVRQADEVILNNARRLLKSAGL
ncbi:MAG: hypothetical protein DRI95_07635 [Bacteroidetes bacterium]|nr:MAG: hypothetical protein DRI95_07635 [Bacteroidota bacterium]